MIDIEKMSVLIVDDMENMCKSIRSMLKILNYGSSYRLAHNGKEALNLLRTYSVDLAIIDWNMPVMTGIELLDNIREDNNLRDLPVVMITAEANSEIVAEAAESDIDAYLLKPITVKTLGSKIQKVVERANHPPESVRLLKEVRTLAETGEMEDAIQTCKMAIEADRNSSRPIRTMGELFFKKGDLKTAELWFVKAAQMNHLDVFAFHHLGDIYMQRQDMDKAFRFYDKAMKISPRHVDRAINFGQILLKAGKIDKAASVFDKAISLSGTPVELREDVARSFLEMGAYNAAIDHLEILNRNFPKRMQYIKMLATCYEGLTNHSKAMEYLLKVHKAEPDNFDVNLKIARVYVETNQTFRAEELLNSLRRQAPENEEVLRLLSKNV